MVEKDLVSATVYYEGQKTLFMGLKETFESLSLVGLSKNSTVEEYAEAVIKNNKADYEIQKDDDLVYFTYEKESNGKKYYYLSALVKGSDAFWLTNFACNESDKDKYKSKFIKWAKTIKVD